MTNKRKRIFILVAVLFGLFGSLVISEIALRVYVAGRGWTPNCYLTNFALLAPDLESGYTLAKSVRVKSSGSHICINSLGLRGPEITVGKPPDTIRIAVLGGSSVFGYSVPEGEDSCRDMQAMLEERGIAAEVINAGVSGYNLTQCRFRYDRVVSSLKPDIVILYLGGNDTAFLIDDFELSGREPKSKTPPAPPMLKRLLSRSTLYGLIRFRLFPEKAPVFAAPESVSSRITERGAREFKRDFDALIDCVESSGTRVVISTQVMATSEGCVGLDWHLGDTPEQIQANVIIGRWITKAVREIAFSRDLPLIDCQREVPCNEEMLGDPIHLTTMGHRKVAKCWVEGVLPLLSQPNGADVSDHRKEVSR